MESNQVVVGLADTDGESAYWAPYISARSLQLLPTTVIYFRFLCHPSESRGGRASLKWCRSTSSATSSEIVFHSIDLIIITIINMEAHSLQSDWLLQRQPD